MKNFFKKLVSWTAYYFLKAILSVRYRVKVKGLDKLTPEVLNKPGGIIFLPNHPTMFVDPTLFVLSVYKKFPIRPLIVEYMYYNPFINPLMRLVDALPIPSALTTSNTFKRKRIQKAIEEVEKSVRKGDNFLIYPAGRIKLSNKEVIGGNSGVYQIIQETPEANVVLVRIKGLWGSRFSKALGGPHPTIFGGILKGIKVALKNLIFFTPKREVIIEFFPEPKDFPRKATKKEFNRYLEKFYNQPDGLTKQEGEEPGDSLVLVSDKFWKTEYPKFMPKEESQIGQVDVDSIDEKIKKEICEKLSQMSDLKAEEITPNMDLSQDLGLDSMDIAEVAAYLTYKYDVKGIPLEEITSVDKVMAIAAGQVQFAEKEQAEPKNYKKWKKKIAKKRLTLAKGKIVPEVFLRNCDRMKGSIACADDISGVLTYRTLKMRAIILAKYIEKLPGKYIGVMLPSSVAAYVTILATQLAGKVPLMVNWTVGSRHLKMVRKLSKVQTILTSWAFIEKLENVDMSGIEDILIMLEDLRHQLGFKEKLKALFYSFLPASILVRLFKLNKISENDPCVLLFTSGTEAAPKGVPLSHKNILSNQKAILEAIEAHTQDSFFGMLPPFHSFGFSLTGIIALLSGVKIAYFADPRDGEGIAKGVKKWQSTIIAGAPSFLKKMVQAADKEDLKTLRYIASGAEKAPLDLLDMLAEHGKSDAFIEGYGITECSPVITTNRSNEPHLGVGRPLSNVEICIVHQDTYEKLPSGTAGLILTRGPNVFNGYLEGTTTLDPFVQLDGKKWYVTGDMGYVDENQYLYLTGRLKRFIKVGGEMISLGAIEDAIIEHAEEKKWQLAKEGPSIAICAKEREGGKPEIVLFALFKTTVEEVNQVLRQAGFSNIVKVSQVITVDEIPLMGTGKINYRKLEKEYIG